MVLAFIILLDIVQLALFFPANQRLFGGGGSKYFIIVHVFILNVLFYSADQVARTWQFSAAYPHTVIPMPLLMFPYT